MKNLGITILLVGFAGLIFTMTMDTSIETASGGRVNNIGLISDKQNFLMLFGVWSLIGAVLCAVGKSAATIVTTTSIATDNASPRSKDEKLCPFCAESIKAAAVVCRFCQRDLPVIAESKPIKTAAPLFSLQGASTETEEDCIKTLTQMGFSVRVASDDGWIVGHTNGVTANCRSLEALQQLTKRHLAAARKGFIYAE